jgi:hypothetical protein
MFPTAFPYDPTLITAVQTTPKSIDDVVSILESIDTTCQPADGLKWFNQLYLQVTEAVRTRVNAGAFENPSWMATLDVGFANYYLSAVRTALSAQPTPGCWQVFFDVRNQSQIARIQFALAGMNAHINHDLPLAVLDISRVTQIAPQHATPQYNDFTALDTTLESLIDQAKRELHVRLSGDSLPEVSTLEDTLAAWSLTAAREAAWNNAELLWHLEDAPPLAASFLETLDGLTALAGKTLLVPVP